MKIGLRKAAVACGTVFASGVLAASTAASAWGSSSALVIGGIATSSMHDVVMSQVLGGALKNQQRVSVHWPAQAAPYTGSKDLTLGASINVGINNLNTQIDAALGRLGADGEKVTVVGLSAGSLVVNEVLRQLAADAEAPGKNEITFVLVADSSRQKLINQTRYNSKFDYTYRPAPETEYDIVVVTGEYDGMADFPDRWWNGLAVMNAIAGSIYVHVPMMFADLSKVPAENVSVDVNSKGGTTTNYLVPTAKLPLVQLFPSLAKREAELKAKIDKAYSRNDARAAAVTTLVAAPVEAVAPVIPVGAQSPEIATAPSDTVAPVHVNDDDRPADTDAVDTEVPVDTDVPADTDVPTEADEADVEADVRGDGEDESESIEADEQATEDASQDRADDTATDDAETADSAGDDSGTSATDSSDSE